MKNKRIISLVLSFAMMSTFCVMPRVVTMAEETKIGEKQIYNGHTYQLYDKEMTWKDAKAYCERMGGHLATISSNDENIVVSELIKKGKKEAYFIGATNNGKKWAWVTNESFNYMNWGKGEPNNTNGSECYLEIVNNPWGMLTFASWNDITLDSEFDNGFICEWDRDYIGIILNKEHLTLDQEPIIIDGRTMVPIRAIAEAIGANVEWNQDTQTVVIQRGLDTVVCEIGKKRMYSYEIQELDVEAQVVNGRTLIPVRALTEVFGADVAWDDSTKTVIINMKEFSDDEIFRDFRVYGFLKFDYFSNSFLGEYTTVDAAVKSIFSEMGDWATRFFTLRMFTYDMDKYKECIEDVLCNITTKKAIDISDSTVDTINDAISESVGITAKGLSELLEKQGAKNVMPARYAKYFDEALGKYGKAISWSKFSAEEIAWILTDFINNMHYLETIEKACASTSENGVEDAITLLKEEYATKYIKVLVDFVNKSIDGLGSVIKGKLSLLGISEFIIEISADIMGWSDAQYVEKTSRMVNVNYELSSYFDKIGEKIYNGNAMIQTATDDDWEEYTKAFEVSKSGFIQEYKYMLHLVKNTAQRTYLNKQLEVLQKLTIREEKPDNVKDMFYFSN